LVLRQLLVPVERMNSDPEYAPVPQNKVNIIQLIFTNACNFDCTYCFEGGRERERVQRKVYATRGEARQNIFDYIEMFYNPKRRHNFNERLSPVEFEKQHFLRLKSI
jgi:MoaA/NifB/PqqE/SkfB family radical SAM enzyme